MSGLSLAVAPRLGSGMNEGEKDVRGQGLMGGVVGSLRVIELQKNIVLVSFCSSASILSRFSEVCELASDLQHRIAF